MTMLYLAVVLIGTALLSLPFATASGRPAGLMTALFTSTTSLCVTGLVTVTTASYWSLFGKIVILFLINFRRDWNCYGCCRHRDDFEYEDYDENRLAIAAEKTP